MGGQIQYSEKYFGDTYECRHVVLPPEVVKLLPKNRLLSEGHEKSNWVTLGLMHLFSLKGFHMLVLKRNQCRIQDLNEWRAIGVQQSRGWVHYAIHRPEPHSKLFRRPLNYQQQQQENQA